MRKSFGVKPYLCPQPVLLIGSYDEMGVADVMNAAWGSMCSMDGVALYISAGHKTMKNILAQKAFTVSMVNEQQVIAADFVGLVSANTIANKLEQAGLHTIKSDVVNAPLISEFPLTLECTLVSYDTDTECLLGTIKNVSADESILDEDGNIDSNKWHPICFDAIHNEYHVINGKVGNAFHDGLALKQR